MWWSSKEFLKTVEYVSKKSIIFFRYQKLILVADISRLYISTSPITTKSDEGAKLIGREIIVNL